MVSNEKQNIKEFLIKEDERFRLVKLGFFESIEAETDYISHNFPQKEGESFARWKVRIIGDFYKRRDFNSFQKNNHDNIFFVRAVKSLMLNRLSKVSSSTEKTDTDRYLAPEGDSISFSLSEEIFEDIYSTRFTTNSSFETPLELDSYCKEIIKSAFPLSEEYVVDELEKNENFYWEKVYRKLKPMTAGFSFQLSGRYGEENLHDMWSDTCFTLNSAVVGKRLQKPTRAKDIISYAVGIIKNKNKEYLRGRKKNKLVDIELVNYKITDESEKNYFDNPSVIPSNFPSQKEDINNYIDTQDEEAVRNYMIVVLYNEEHPLHSRLVEGYEEKIKLMYEHYLDNLSYEEIVNKYYGEVSEEEMVRIAARVRQDVKRVKERLRKRFESIINQACK